MAWARDGGRAFFLLLFGRLLYRGAHTGDTATMSDVRIGIIGCGGMGGYHAKQIAEGRVTGAVLGALCDIDGDAIRRTQAATGKDLPAFASAEALFKARAVDAVVIATPHYDHPPLAIAGLQTGHHVMVEKPAGVYTKQVREMNAAAAQSDRIFGLMLNQRTQPVHRKVRDLLAGGELGALKRNAWIVTSWYRSQSYYDSGGWRATWSGEGGGVLVNQCPHQLDLWQWFCGMPKRVRAFCRFGQYHDIEVEDDVTAYVEYPDGSTGTFITSTGEAPGTNRFEVSGNNGRLVMEGGKLEFMRNRVGEREFNATYRGGFGEPECWRCEVPAPGQGEEHVGVLKQFVKAIVANDAGQLVARGEEGVRGVELANAMQLSTWLDAWVALPIDEDLFLEKLQEKIRTSRYVKKTSGMKLSVDGTFKA